jgi:hypothetical protein
VTNSYGSGLMYEGILVYATVDFGDGLAGKVPVALVQRATCVYGVLPSSTASSLFDSLPMKPGGHSIVTWRRCNSPTVCLSHGAPWASAYLASFVELVLFEHITIALSARDLPRAATGLSLAACSRIRAGAKVPHPRHWKVLRKLADS